MTAKEYFKKCFPANRLNDHDTKAVIRVMEDYKSLKCEEQRQICVEFFINGGNRQGSFIAEDLLNAPEPE